MFQKNSFNLLKDWYFCCCMGCSPGTTSKFLTSLEFLDNPETTRRTKSIALEQIFLIDDTSMIIYSLPQVLIAFSRQTGSEGFNLTDIDRKTACDFYEKLIQQLCTSTYSPLLIQLLRQALYPNSKTDKIRDILKQGRFNWNWVKLETDNVPYKDIQYFPEASLLSAFIAFLSGQVKVRELFKTEGEILFRDFFNNAINNQYGRFAFGQVFLLPKDLYSIREGLQNLWNGTLSNISEFEPDILSWFAHAEFTEKTYESQSGGTMAAENILEEYKTLSLLISKVKIDLLDISTKEYKRREKDIDRFMLQTGTKSKGDAKRASVMTLPFLIWQGILLDLLVKTDPGYAFIHLAITFTQGKQKNIVKFNLPDSGWKAKYEKIYEQLAFFRAYHGGYETPKVRLSVSGDKPEITDGGWLIHSPFLCVNLTAVQIGQFTCFHRYELPPSLLMVSASVLPVIRLLQGAKQEKEKSKFLGLLVHAEALFLIFRNWLARKQDHEYLDFDTDYPGSKKLQFPLTGLVQSCRRALHMVGSGMMESIPPSNFVEDLAFRFSNLTDDVRDGENLFATNIYPGVLMTWIQNAMLGFDNSQNGQDRWRELVLNVFGFYQEKQLSATKPHGQTPIALILRMFHPNIYLEQEFVQHITWKAFLDLQTGKSEYYNPRNCLLVSNQITLNDWFNQDWLHGLQNHKREDTLRLIRGIEALTLISEKPNEIKKETVFIFFNEVGDAARKIEDLEKWDRFLRIRLLEFLKTLNHFRLDEYHGLHWEKLQLYCVFSLLEFGSSYELGVMLDLIFPFNQEGELLENNHYQHLQRPTLNAICRMVFPRLSIKQVPVGTDTPFDHLLEANKEDLLSGFLNRIGYASWLSRTKGYEFSTGNLALKYHDLVLEEAAGQGTPQGDYFKGEPIKMNPSNFTTIIYDPNKKRGRYFYQNPMDGATGRGLKVINLFNDNKAAMRETEITVLGYVTSLEEHIKFNCGLPNLVEAIRNPESTMLQRGDPAIVKLTKQSGVWSCTNYYPCIQESSKSIVEFNLTPKKLFVEINLRTKNRSENDRVRSLEEWFPDFTWLINQDPETFVEPCLGKLTPEKQLGEPVHFYLDSFLSHEVPMTRHSVNLTKFAITVSFVKEKPSLSSGTSCFVFSTAPGKLFQLYPSNFTTETMGTLLPMLKDSENRGLLITFIPTLDSMGSPRLSLVPQQETGWINANYPNLSTPFDERNLEYRSLFSRSIDDEPFLKAKKSANHWILMNGPEGYGDIRVQLEGTEKMDPSAMEILFTKTTWDPYNRILTGKPDTRQKIEPVDGGYTHLMTFSRWDTLRIKSLISINEYLNDAWGRTHQGSEVSVPITSLTMLPLEPELARDRTLQKAMEDREVVIENCYEKKIGNVTVTFHGQSIPTFSKALVIEKSGLDKHRFKIWWEIKNGALMEDVTIRADAAKDSVQLGDSLYPLREGFQLCRWRIIARAIWKPTPLINSAQSVYIGSVNFKNETLFLAESKINPGKFYYLDKDPNTVHLAEVNSKGEFTLRNGAPGEWHLSPNFPINPDAKKSVFLMRYGKKIVGLIDGRRHNPSALQLDKVELSIQRSGEGFLLERNFIMEVQPDMGNKVGKKRVFATTELIDSFNKGLDSYLHCECRIGKDRQISIRLPEGMKVPLTSVRSYWDEEQNWSSNIDLIQNEVVYIQSRIDSYDEKDCLFVPVSQGDMEVGYRASFMKVKPFTLSGFKALGSSFVDSRNILRKRIFYEGFHENTSFGEDFPVENGPYFLFEFGFGQTLCIPVSTIRMMNPGAEPEPLENYTNLLFHGDEITGAEIRNVNSIETLVIKKVQIQQSEASQLYQQGQNRIIHLVYYNPQTDEVTKILGLDHRNSSELHKEFKNSGAFLSKETREKLKDKIEEWKKQELSEVAFYATINNGKEEGYHYSQGRKLAMNCLKLHFDHSKEVINELNDSLVFVKAIEIEKGVNEYEASVKFEVTTLLNLPHELKKLSIKRRDFSCDEETLSRYYARNEKIKDKIFLVRLHVVQKESTMRVLPRIIDRNDIASILLRSENHLASIATLRGNVYVTFLKEEGEKVIVEYKPGIFFQIMKSNWKLPINLLRGDLLKVISNDNGHQMKCASLSDEHFITETPRQVVLLPMNDFNREEILEGMAKKKPTDPFKQRVQVSIGSFPNLTMDLWYGITCKEVIDMMMKRDRFCEIYRNTQGTIKIRSVGKNHTGRLSWKGYMPSVILYGESEPHPINPRMISHMDDTITAIYEYSERASWGFHDWLTPVWEKTESGIQGKMKSLARRTINTGPLFFESKGGQFSLRYTESNRVSFGYPVRELLHTLMSAPEKKETFVFVGTDNNQSGNVTGIWVELAPGRMTIIPIDLLLFRIDTEKRESYNFDWKLMTTGDRLVLSLDGVQDQVRDQLIIEQWIPGSRGLYGRGEIITRVTSVHSKGEPLVICGISIGSNQFELIIPYTQPIESGTLIHLDLQTNKLIIVDAFSPEKTKRTTIGLLIVKDEQLRVSGFEMYGIELNLREWQLMLATQTTDNPKAIMEELKEIVTILGALPITIEEVSKERMVMGISLRRQQHTLEKIIATDCFSAGRIVGSTRDNNLFMRFGNQLVTLSPKQLIEGIQHLDDRKTNELSRVISSQKAKLEFWCHNENGIIKSGLPGKSELGKGNRATVLFQPTVDSGIILKMPASMELIHVETEQALLSPPTESLLQGTFRPGDVFPVIRMPDKRFSIVRSTAIVEWFKKIKISDWCDMKVINVEDTGNKKVCVVKHNTGVIASCDFFSGIKPLRDAMIKVCITDKIETGGLPGIVLKGGIMPYELDFPLDVENEDNFGIFNEDLTGYSLPDKGTFTEEDVIRVYAHLLHPEKKGIVDVATTDSMIRFIERVQKEHISVSLLPSLSSISLMLKGIVRNKSKYGSADKVRSIGLLHSFRQRFLRNIHVEILSRVVGIDWEQKGGMKERFKSIATRLRIFEKADKTTFTESEINRFRTFSEAVFIKEERELQPEADALLACLGELQSNASFISKPLLLTYFAGLFNTLQPGNYLEDGELDDVLISLAITIDQKIREIVADQLFIPLLPLENKLHP